MAKYQYEGTDSSGNAVTAEAEFEGEPSEVLYIEHGQGGTARVTLVADAPKTRWPTCGVCGEPARWTFHRGHRCPEHVQW